MSNITIKTSISIYDDRPFTCGVHKMTITETGDRIVNVSWWTVEDVKDRCLYFRVKTNLF